MFCCRYEAPAAYEGMKTEAPNCDYGGEFKSIEAVDQFTVKMTLCNPDPAYLSKVAFAAFQIQDSDYLDEMGGDSAKMAENPNGTGAYVVKEWVRGDHITFEANPNYWGEAPTIKTLIFRWSAEAAQRLLELQSGTVDAVFAPAAEDFETIQADSNLVLIPYDSPNVFYLGMNNTIPPFDNDKVRQAMAMAIDKKGLVDLLYPPGSTVAEQFVPPSIVPGFSTTGDGAKHQRSLVHSWIMLLLVRNHSLCLAGAWITRMQPTSMISISPVVCLVSGKNGPIL